MSAAVGVLSLLIGGLLVTTAPANASTGHEHGQDVWITVTGDGSHARVSGSHVRPGWVTLHLADRTSPTIGVQLTVARMRDHYPVSRLLADIAVQVDQNSTPAQSAASTRDINRIAVALGGGDTMDGQPYFRSDTVKLSGHGTYYLINSGAKSGPAVVGRLDAGGRGNTADAPRYSGVITLGTGTADTITLSGRMPSHGTVRVRNSGDSVHLLAISKVADGVTDAQVQAEYDIVMAGGTPTSDPAGLFSPPTVTTGSDAVSPGHASIFRYYLPRGTYLLQCFVDDATTGIPHAFMGMHLVVHVH
ncbi:MAG TPA: hypothetical protein VMB79_15105 [Jatrophihabitans sp.]|nr:hypothetical protein [Jatrophihabitans sp.]